MKRTAILAAILAPLLVGRSARAQDTSTLGAVDLYGNPHTIGVTLTISGDADGDARATMTYRTEGGPDWPGHPLVRLPGDRFVGSLFYLDPGTTYDVTVTLDDPDNGGPLTLTASGATRADTPPTAGGGELWVDAAGGDDANDGSAGAPLATIQAAADRAQPGDTIRVLPGLYYESVVPPQGGAPGAPIIFRGEGPGAVLSGADATIAEGTPIWTEHQNGIYWTDYAGSATYLAADDLRIYDYLTLADLAEENGKIGLPGALPGGFFVDNAQQRLYLRLPDRSHPSGWTIYVGARNRGFLFDTIGDIVIEGFEIRHFSEVGVDIRDSSRVWVQRNNIHHLGRGVRIRRDNCFENVIEDNQLRDTSVYFWPWDSCKGETCEASAVSVTGGEGNLVRRNRIEGFFNGVYTGSFGTTDEAIARHTDVYENTIFQIGDDGLEPEGACVNHRFWENAIVEVFNAISLAPIEIGPTWLVRNVVVDYRAHVLKVNNGTSGHLFVYHTTSVPDPQAPDVNAIAPSIPFGGIVSRNNIWTANRYVIEYIDATLTGPVSFDYDNLYTLNADGGSRFVKWFDVRYADLGELQAGTGMWPNGLQVLPEYEDPGAGDFTPTATSPLVNAGELLPGINDRFFVETAPDIGAFERGGIQPGPDDGGLPWPDGGGTIPPDGGVGPGPDAGNGHNSGDKGCGCTNGGETGAGLLLLLVLAWLWRRRRTATTMARRGRP